MELKELRDSLDITDAVLEEAFARRMETVAKIGRFKREHGIATLDRSREEEVLRLHTENTADGLKPYMAEFFEAVMAISRKYQDAEKEK